MSGPEKSPWRRPGAVAALSLLVAGCAITSPRSPEHAAAALAPDPSAPRLPPLDTSRYEGLDAKTEVVGQVEVLFTRYENTFSAIARQYDLGYEAMRHANPHVDQWLPGEGTPVFLPTRSILPAAPHEGIVVNLPAMRLFYYRREKKSASSVLAVTTHPIGIGRDGWATPTGVAKVVHKVEDPAWYVPASVRKEHAEAGDPLPAVVPPGPDNPLGQYALQLSLPGYLIHGTNKPAGVGMRVSHGCIRLYPEDIETLFRQVPRGTPVRIVDQPVLAGWVDGTLYLEVHPALEDGRDLAAEAEKAIAAAEARGSHPPLALNREAVARVVAEKRGIPFPVGNTDQSLEAYLAAARIVANTVPVATAAAAD